MTVYHDCKMAHERGSSPVRSTSLPGGIRGANRERLAELHRSFRGPFSVADAAWALDEEEDTARRLLGYLSRRGWLSRVRRGLYLAVPLDAAQAGEWVEDPWIVAARAFRPAYIGGWSAAEHWSLTEQVFRDVVVVTPRDVRQRHHVLQGQTFLVTRRAEEKVFGLRTVWRRDVRVEVSDPSRTVVDVLDDPSIGGGIRHVTSILREYMGSEHCSEAQVVQYGDRLGNRAVFKRLGWILEVLGVEGPLREACAERRSAGLVKLDPTVEGEGRIVRRWGLRVNVALDERADDW